MASYRLKELKKGRLIYYYSHADAGYWDNYWKKQVSAEYFKKYELGQLDEYSSVFLKYLHKDHRILEAGCGTGRYVLALKSLGFNGIEGIEWGPETVEIVKHLYPDLPITVGDVTKINVSNCYYDEYISLGVVEHRKEGPEPFLNEAFRVLKSGGLALFTVPYINPFRTFKGRLGFYNIKRTDNYEFYQYAFSKEEFCELLERAGFTILETRGLAGYFGMQEELPILFKLLAKIRGGWRISKYIQNTPWIINFSHMCCFVCEKR